MSILNESATELYNRLILELPTKAKKSLELVKTSCDDIELARGIINYSKVAEFATKHYGGPSKQTVQNNKNLKNYIYKRMCEYKTWRKNSTDRNNETKYKDVYPTENLDIKTRTYINHMRDAIRHLETKVSNLNQILETATRKTPIHFSEVISKGIQQDGGLSIAVPQNKAIPGFLYPFLRKLFGLDKNAGRLKSFEVKCRDNKYMLVNTDGMINETILTPAEWDEIGSWLVNVQYCS
ncbi:MAG: hypothetical protein K0R49_1262 [Burkholderiales bacterium]|jgi:hypothetical protein|nr:hypothetical protein [Burkholderiales bacterium]